MCVAFTASISIAIPPEACVTFTEQDLSAIQCANTKHFSTLSTVLRYTLEIQQRSLYTLRITTHSVAYNDENASTVALEGLCDVLKTFFLHYIQKGSFPIAKDLHVQKSPSFDNSTILHENSIAKAAVMPLVLLGGKSTRMGKDKATLTYHHATYIENISSILHSLFDSVAVSVRTDQTDLPHVEKFHKIQDRFLHFGPLSGILSALYENSNVAWLVLPSDLPNITRKTLTTLLSAREKAPTNTLATAFYNLKRNAPEPLCTIYEPGALPILLQCVAQKITCPTALLPYLHPHYIPIESDELDNINTPEEYSSVLTKMQESS